MYFWYIYLHLFIISWQIEILLPRFASRFLEIGLFDFAFYSMEKLDYIKSLATTMNIFTIDFVIFTSSSLLSRAFSSFCL